MCNDCFSVDAFPSAPRAKEKHIQMFQSKSYIERRHGKIGVDRATYLKQLVQEFETTDNKEAKKQVLANLANFAYDPINYNTLWDLHAVNLFLTSLTDSDPLLREFGIGGLANICLEPRHHEYILSQPVFRDNIIDCVNVQYTLNTKVNAMTTLMQLMTLDNYATILTDKLRTNLQKIQRDQQHVQAKNMASLFLHDYYHQTS